MITEVFQGKKLIDIIEHEVGGKYGELSVDASVSNGYFGWAIVDSTNRVVRYGAGRIEDGVSDSALIESYVLNKAMSLYRNTIIFSDSMSSVEKLENNDNRVFWKSRNSTIFLEHADAFAVACRKVYQDAKSDELFKKLCEKYGCEPNGLPSTIRAYNKACHLNRVLDNAESSEEEIKQAKLDYAQELVNGLSEKKYNSHFTFLGTHHKLIDNKIWE